MKQTRIRILIKRVCGFFAERIGMRKGYKKQMIRRYVVITFAAILYGIGIGCFLDPNNLAPGGITGISVIINRFTPIPTGTLYLLFNIPILLIGAWKFGVKFLIPTFYAIVLVSFFTNRLAVYGPITDEPLLAAIAGSGCVATGIGMIFRVGGTTGGLDIIVKILRTKYKHIKTGNLFFLIDCIIVCCSGLVFRNFNVAMYALITVILNGRILDFVLYGSDEAKLLYIISDKPEQIGARLLQEVDNGVTYLEGEGGYSSERKKILMCVTRKQQAPKVEEIVKEEDGNAFLIITSANEIYGQGYKNIYSEKL